MQSPQRSAGCTPSSSRCLFVPGARLSDLAIPPIRQLPPEFDRWLPLIAHARCEIVELITQNARTRSLSVGVTHNDIFPGNVLVQDGQVTALLDWEEADIDWLVWDLASSIWPFCSTAGGELDRNAMEDFLDSYRAAGGRTPSHRSAATSEANSGSTPGTLGQKSALGLSAREPPGLPGA